MWVEQEKRGVGRAVSTGDLGGPPSPLQVFHLKVRAVRGVKQE